MIRTHIHFGPRVAGCLIKSINAQTIRPISMIIIGMSSGSIWEISFIVCLLVMFSVAYRGDSVVSHIYYLNLILSNTATSCSGRILRGSFSLAFAKSTYLSMISYPTNRRPRCLATFVVCPEPTNGSITNSSG